MEEVLLRLPDSLHHVLYYISNITDILSLMKTCKYIRNVILSADLYYKVVPMHFLILFSNMRVDTVRISPLTTKKDVSLCYTRDNFKCLQSRKKTFPGIQGYLDCIDNDPSPKDLSIIINDDTYFRVTHGNTFEFAWISQNIILSHRNDYHGPNIYRRIVSLVSKKYYITTIVWNVILRRKEDKFTFEWLQYLFPFAKDIVIASVRLPDHININFGYIMLDEILRYPRSMAWNLQFTEIKIKLKLTTYFTFTTPEMIALRSSASMKEGGSIKMYVDAESELPDSINISHKFSIFFPRY